MNRRRGRRLGDPHSRSDSLGTIGRVWRENSVLDLLLAQALPLISTLLVTFVTARLLGPDGRGALIFVVSTASLLGAALFGSLHVGTALSTRRDERGATRTGAMLAAMPVGLLMALGLLQWLALPEYAYGLLTRSRSLVICFVAAAQVVNLFLSRTLQAIGASRSYRRCITLQATSYAAGALTSLAINRQPESVIGAQFVSLLLAAAYAGVSLRSYLAQQKRPAGGRARLWQVARTSLAAHAASMGQQLLFRADVIVLGLLSTPRQVGVYSVATPIAELVWVASQALELAAFAEGHQTLDQDRRQARLHQLLRLNLLFSAGVSPIIIAATVFLLPLVLPSYGAAIPLVLILLPGVIVAGATRIMLSSLLAADVPRLAVLSGTASIALAVVYVPFVLAWGATGAAVASTGVYLGQACVLLTIRRRMMRKPADV